MLELGFTLEEVAKKSMAIGFADCSGRKRKDVQNCLKAVHFKSDRIFLSFIRSIVKEKQYTQSSP